MANIFDVTNERNNDVRQNPFDWSHQSNLTGRLGFIYPFFADVVPAKTSFRCIPRLGLQFMPMVFPVQTRMKARVSFFRVPLRTLWKDYKDYIGNFKQGLVEPYLDLATSFEKFMGTGKLADYLNIPTVLVGKYGSSIDFTLPAAIVKPLSSSFRPCFYQNKQNISALSVASSYLVYGDSAPSWFAGCERVYYAAPLKSDFTPDASFVAGFLSSTLPAITLAYTDSFATSGTRFVPFECELHLAGLNGNSVVTTAKLASFISSPKDTSNGWELFTKFEDFQSGDLVFDNPLSDTVNTWQLVIALKPFSAATAIWSFVMPYYEAFSGVLSFESGTLVLGTEVNEHGYAEITRDTSPYFDSTSANKDRQLKLDAYTARAYEAIYNAYMRDNRNNPYYRNGQLEYNVWIPTDEGGADTYPYELHRANWEKDFLTTAVPSPQQGRAPLVGLTSYTTAEEVDGITQTSLRLALVDEDGKRYALRFSSDESGVNGVDYAELGDGVAPQALSFRSLVDAASTGISIPDLRMVNAYQKFLELNMRKGYSYKEIVEGRFDCQVRYDDLNIPEFLGGFTRDVNMNRVVQSVERDPSSQYPTGSYANALGSLAGDAFLAAEGLPISCFCDEESVIMGLISIVPVPNYSQLLPKHYLYRDLLDHFQPEFDNLGFQPITYKEVCPIQAFNAGDDLNGTFGYQRAWYDLVQRTDQVHGLFRTQLRDFLMNRVFDAKPTLTKSFLLVDDEQLNDVFAVTETTDKFTGQIWMDCQVKLPVSRVSIPRLD